MKSEIINKVSNDEYLVGTFTISKQDDKWLVTNKADINATALYFDKYGAIHNAILIYTCGQMVQDTVRDFIAMMATERLELESELGGDDSADR